MTRRYVGRDLTDADLDTIRAICADPNFPTRAVLVYCILGRAGVGAG